MWVGNTQLNKIQPMLHYQAHYIRLNKINIARTHRRRRRVRRFYSYFFLSFRFRAIVSVRDVIPPPFQAPSTASQRKTRYTQFVFIEKNSFRCGRSRVFIFRSAPSVSFVFDKKERTTHWLSGFNFSFSPLPSWADQIQAEYCLNTCATFVKICPLENCVMKRTAELSQQSLHLVPDRPAARPARTFLGIASLCALSRFSFGFVRSERYMYINANLFPEANGPRERETRRNRNMETVHSCCMSYCCSMRSRTTKSRDQMCALANTLAECHSNWGEVNTIANSFFRRSPQASIEWNYARAQLTNDDCWVCNFVHSLLSCRWRTFVSTGRWCAVAVAVWWCGNCPRMCQFSQIAERQRMCTPLTFSAEASNRNPQFTLFSDAPRQIGNVSPHQQWLSLIQCDDKRPEPTLGGAASSHFGANANIAL